MKFVDLNLRPELLRAVAELGYISPTEIQEKAIPVLLEGEQDFIGQAQTGTGKTAAFVLPLLSKLNPKAQHIQALVLTPTRELANQVCLEVEKLGKYLGFNTLAIYGGTSYDNQKRRLKKDRPSIIVGTPGRVIDLMEQGHLKFGQAEYIVLDEADEMLNMGFFEDVKTILAKFEESKRLWMFSATMPKPILDLIQKSFNNPKIVKIQNKTMSNEDIDQRYYVVLRKNHGEALCRILDTEPNFYGLIFCRTKVDTREVADELITRGYKVDTLNGDMGQNERDTAMAKFKSQKVNILVCTDVAARGIDVSNLTHVVNYNLPMDSESYVHRIGRTGRAGMKGISISLVDPKELFKVRKIEQFTKKLMTKSKLPTIETLKSSIVLAELERMSAIIQAITEKGSDFKVDESYEIFANKFNEFSKEEILKIFFSLSFNQKLKRFNQLGNIDCEKSSNSISYSSNGSVRLFMNMGKDDGLNLKMLLDDVSKEFSIPRNQIQKVELKNRFSFFEVPAQLGDTFVNNKNLIIRRRKINFEISQPRK